MTTRGRRTWIVSGSLLIVAVGAFLAWSSSSAGPQASASASGSAESTSTPGPSTATTPSVSTATARGTSTATTPNPSTPAPVPTRTPAPGGHGTVPPPVLARVEVVTTFAGWNATSRAVQVGGYAAVVEPVGTCTLRLLQGDKVITHRHPATADATTVACGGFSVPGSELKAGKWQAVLTYASSRSAGEAPAVTVRVP